jgi:hypothetical protein
MFCPDGISGGQVSCVIRRKFTTSTRPIYVERSCSVRFLENGADIPDELIRAVNEGTATFLCGAGVSLRVDLPSSSPIPQAFTPDLEGFGQVRIRQQSTAEHAMCVKLSGAKKCFGCSLANAQKSSFLPLYHPRCDRQHRPGLHIGQTSNSIGTLQGQVPRDLTPRE